eukprot:GDKJ01014633.1.p1 GENE.GDKJ01014633.1~~GDKJ01014633.1.p1  ORF type:complete len:948 (+),score=269.81 GDKJ01014633.1:926-3769(+)
MRNLAVKVATEKRSSPSPSSGSELPEKDKAKTISEILDTQHQQKQRNFASNVSHHYINTHTKNNTNKNNSSMNNNQNTLIKNNHNNTFEMNATSQISMTVNSTTKQRSFSSSPPQATSRARRASLWLLSKWRGPLDDCELWNSLCIILIIFYTSFCMATLSIFNCYEHPQSDVYHKKDVSSSSASSGQVASPERLWSVQIVPNVLCYSNSLDESWLNVFLPIGIITSIIFCFGFLAFIVLINFRAPEYADPVARGEEKAFSFLVRYSFLFSRYRHDVWWWEAVVMSRNLLLCLIACFVHEAPIKLILYLCVVVFAAIAQTLYLPLLDWSTNFLEICCLMCLSLFSAGGLYFSSLEDPSSASSSWMNSLSSTSSSASSSSSSSSASHVVVIVLLVCFALLGIIGCVSLVRGFLLKFSLRERVNVIEERCLLGSLLHETLRVLSKGGSGEVGFQSALRTINPHDAALVKAFLTIAKTVVLPNALEQSAAAGDEEAELPDKKKERGESKVRSLPLDKHTSSTFSAVAAAKHLDSVFKQHERSSGHQETRHVFPLPSSASSNKQQTLNWNNNTSRHSSASNHPHTQKDFSAVVAGGSQHAFVDHLNTTNQSADNRQDVPLERDRSATRNKVENDIGLIEKRLMNHNNHNYHSNNSWEGKKNGTSFQKKHDFENNPQQYEDLQMQLIKNEKKKLLDFSADAESSSPMIIGGSPHKQFSPVSNNHLNRSSSSSSDNGHVSQTRDDILHNTNHTNSGTPTNSLYNTNSNLLLNREVSALTFNRLPNNLKQGKMLLGANTSSNGVNSGETSAKLQPVKSVVNTQPFSDGLTLRDLFTSPTTTHHLSNDLKPPVEELRRAVSPMAASKAPRMIREVSSAMMKNEQLTQQMLQKRQNAFDPLPPPQQKKVERGGDIKPSEGILWASLPADDAIIMLPQDGFAREITLEDKNFKIQDA